MQINKTQSLLSKLQCVFLVLGFLLVTLHAVPYPGENQKVDDLMKVGLTDAQVQSAEMKFLIKGDFENGGDIISIFGNFLLHSHFEYEPSDFSMDVYRRPKRKSYDEKVERTYQKMEENARAHPWPGPVRENRHYLCPISLSKKRELIEEIARMDILEKAVKPTTSVIGALYIETSAPSSEIELKCGFDNWCPEIVRTAAEVKELAAGEGRVEVVIEPEEGTTNPCLALNMYPNPGPTMREVKKFEPDAYEFLMEYIERHFESGVGVVTEQ